MKNMKKILVFALSLLLVLGCVSFSFADTPWDEILNYTITVDINEDASANLTYHVDWKALKDDNGKYPLEDVYIGIPNRHYKSITAISSNISTISYDSSKTSAHIYFDHKVKAGEVISFDFVVVQDFMYEMNRYEDGYTLYYFMPGWFDEIDVDNITIRWNSDKTAYYDSGATIDGNYIVWTDSLKAGEATSVQVSYPNDAFNFNEASNINGGSSYNDDEPGFFIYLLALLIVLGFTALPVIFIAILFKAIYDSFAGFSQSKTVPKITRTKVTYYDSCPNCGAPRKEGTAVCPYCETSLVKSEEILKETDVKDVDKEAFKYKKTGEYKYTGVPDTYVRVNVVHVPASRSSSSSSSSKSSSSSNRGSSISKGGHTRSSSSSHSSCAHSSCACACASCACACACACAGGGRAGCSTKDFYNTNLKLTQLELRAKKKKS